MNQCCDAIKMRAGSSPISRADAPLAAAAVATAAVKPAYGVPLAPARQAVLPGARWAGAAKENAQPAQDLRGATYSCVACGKDLTRCAFQARVNHVKKCGEGLRACRMAHTMSFASWIAACMCPLERQSGSRGENTPLAPCPTIPRCVKGEERRCQQHPAGSQSACLLAGQPASRPWQPPPCDAAGLAGRHGPRQVRPCVGACGRGA